MATNKKPKFKAANRRRPLSNVPVLLGLSLREKTFMKSVPHKALKAFKENIATDSCWYTLAFRLKVALELAKICYQEVTVEEISESFLAVLQVRKRFQESVDQVWSATAQEIDAIEMGLEAIDIMQDETTRRHQLSAHHIADAYMKNITKEVVDV